MASKIVKYINEENHSLGQGSIIFGRCGKRWVWARFSEKERTGLSEELKERGREFGKDKIDLGKQLIRSDMGSPLAKDGMGSLKNTNVNVVVSP